MTISERYEIEKQAEYGFKPAFQVRISLDLYLNYSNSNNSLNLSDFFQ